MFMVFSPPKVADPSNQFRHFFEKSIKKGAKMKVDLMTYILIGFVIVASVLLLNLNIISLVGLRLTELLECF